MPSEERIHRILRHTEEVVTEDELTELVATKESPSVYIGYAPTGEMHIGHFTTIRKVVDFLDAGLDVTVLIADLHAHLDDEKSPFSLLEARSEYYRIAIEGMVNAAGGDSSAVTFVNGSDFELEQPYTLELFRLAAETTTTRAQRAGSEVVRQRDNPRLGGLLYTLMQSLDVAALDADIAYGGIDQRGIYMLAREVLPTIGYDKPICLFAPLLSGLEGGKMSASERESKIGVTDSSDEITEKISAAYCPAGSTENNGVLEYLEYLVFPILSDRGEPFVIDRPEEYGGRLTFETYDALETAYLDGLHPQDLKNGTANALVDILEPVGSAIRDRPDVLARAYPETYDE